MSVIIKKNNHLQVDKVRDEGLQRMEFTTATTTTVLSACLALLCLFGGIITHRDGDNKVKPTSR